MEYAVYLPPGYRQNGIHPLVVFLHGAMARGEDGRRQLTEGLAPWIAYQARAGRAVEFIALFPQSFSGQWTPESEDGRLVMKVVSVVTKTYPVDPDRVYLMGFSEGGSGVWGLAAEHPDTWAALVPIAGRASVDRALAIKHIPCWCFQGQADRRVSVSETRRLIEAVRAVGGRPRYTEYLGRGHDIAVAPFVEPEFFPWVLSQRRRAEQPPG
jgi:predicted peptidase